MAIYLVLKESTHIRDAFMNMMYVLPKGFGYREDEWGGLPGLEDRILLSIQEITLCK